MINPSEIQRLRKKFNLTQTKLAQLSKVSQSYITKIEQGLIDPTYSKLKKLNDVFQTLNNNKGIKAKDIMNKEIFFIKPNEKIKKAINLLKKHQISQILVIDNHLIGLITENDIIKNLGSKKEIVKDIMSLAPPIINPETPKEIIIEIIKFYPIIVVKNKKKIQGVITRSDLLNYQ